jgi:hypothetical protein
MRRLIPSFAAVLLFVFAAPAIGGELTDVQKTYKAAAAEAGRDPAAHVKLALWCESHGLSAERQKHLAIAVLFDPANALARALMGLVKDGDSWRRPEQVAAQVKSDEKLAAALAEYNDKRENTGSDAESQWKQALWCEEKGLTAESRAHLTTVVRLDPSREAAWKRLGYKKTGSRWMTREQIESAKAEQVAQEKADRHWGSLLEKAREDLRSAPKRSDAEAALGKVDDPRAIPSVLRTFARPSTSDQERAVQLLGQIDCASSSRALAVFAADGASDKIRRVTCETLRHRDPREYVGFLINRLGDPTPFTIGTVAQRGALFRVLTTEEPDRYVMNVYERPVAGPLFNQRGAVALPSEASAWLPGVLSTGWGSDPFSQSTLQTYQSMIQARQEAELVRQAQVAEGTDADVMRDAQALTQRNAVIAANNAGIFQALENTTGEKQPNDREAWKAWFLDKLGYRYEKPNPAKKPVVFAQRFSSSGSQVYECFAAGTPVKTLSGSKAIETLKVGDRVLAQNTQTGSLSYQPILTVYKNPPAETVKIELDDETIVPSTLHRFWKVGQGWALARELQPGDLIRTLRGPAVVKSVKPESTQPVFNLDVDASATFFVGKAGALVHDNRMPELRSKGFDARPELVVRAGRD